MKETRSRARRLKTTVSAYGPSRGSRSNHCAREGFWSRTRRAGSGQPVFGRGAVSLLQPCYVWEFRGSFVSLSLLSLCFVIIIKYSRAQREKASYPHPHLSLLLQDLMAVTNFIRPYLHQFSIDSHGLNGYGKPLKRPFYRYQSRLEAINNGRDIRQINW